MYAYKMKINIFQQLEKLNGQKVAKLDIDVNRESSSVGEENGTDNHADTESVVMESEST